MTASEYTPARVKALTRMQSIATVEEQYEPRPAPISDAQMLATVRAALASAQRDRFQLERQVEQLQAEVRRLLVEAQKLGTGPLKEQP